MLKKIWHHLSKRRQKQFWLLLVLMIIASLAEVVSLGAVLPFLGALTAPEELYKHVLMQPVIQFLEITKPNQLLLPLTIVFIISAIFAGGIRILLLYVMTRLSFSTGADISLNIYQRTLYQEYAVHVDLNSSEVINGIVNKTGAAISVIQSFLTIISSIIMMFSMMFALFAIDITVALIASVGFGGLYLGVVFYTRKQLKKNSQCIADQSTQMIKSLQEGLGGIRDVLIDGSQQFYCNLYRSADLSLRKASGNNVFIAASPRYAMEMIGMLLIAGLAYTMSLRGDGMFSAIPTLGALALGAQRLLPVLQQAYSAYSTIKGAQASFEDVLKLLDQPLPRLLDQSKQKPISFEKEIILDDISFRYMQDSPWIINKINLKLSKGSRTGFMGQTGSGKSTLIDIVMGLLSPTKGELIIDGQPITSVNRNSWQMHIAHVPQNIYLSDSSIEENIAFGIPKEKIDYKRVKKSAQQAQIAAIIEEWPEKYQTFVGERGIRLSGGQRQRIGIARAIYRQADVLVFDEATSALDSETEKSVMEAIGGLGKNLTILIIAHRLSTLRGCDQIIELSKGKSLITKNSHEIYKITS